MHEESRLKVRGKRFVPIRVMSVPSLLDDVCAESAVLEAVSACSGEIEVSRGVGGIRKSFEEVAARREVKPTIAKLIPIEGTMTGDGETTSVVKQT